MKDMLTVFKAIVTVIAGVLFLFFYIRYLEQKSLYYPEKEINATPADINLSFKDVYFLAEDKVKLHGWFIPAKNAKATILFFHGNGGNISYRLEKIALFNQLNVNMFIFDYRGYGKSQGVSTEAGIYKDAQAAYQFVVREAQNREKFLPIILYGESLGGAIAVDLAAKVEIKGLILEGTFTNVADMAKIVYPWMPAGFLKTKFDSIAKIPHVKAAKLHFHGRLDDIVPLRLGKELFEAAKQPKTFILLEGAHNDGFFTSEDNVRKQLAKFIKAVQGS